MVTNSLPNLFVDAQQKNKSQNCISMLWKITFSSFIGLQHLIVAGIIHISLMAQLYVFAFIIKSHFEETEGCW